MIVSQVALSNYRNWSTLSLSPHPRLNLIRGANAQGKSNLLEALYALVTTRPYRAQKDFETIRFGEQYSRVHAVLQSASRNLACDLVWQKLGDGDRTRKEIKINQQPVHRLLEVFGMARMVLFAPHDLDLVTGGPDSRRRYLDILLSQLYPAHLHALHQYQRVLHERNRWLRNAKSSAAGLGEVFDEQLVRWGSSIVERRLSAVATLSPLLERIYRHLSGRGESVQLGYDSAYLGEIGEPVPSALARHLLRRRSEELVRGVTLVGPHRDDLKIHIDNHAARSFASQGQMRSLAVAMRMAEGEMLQQAGGDCPVLLLDDCLSEIDASRQQALWQYLSDRGQVFLTTCNWEARLPFSGRIFEIGEGQVYEVEVDACCA